MTYNYGCMWRLQLISLSLPQYNEINDSSKNMRSIKFRVAEYFVIRSVIKRIATAKPTNSMYAIAVNTRAIKYFLLQCRSFPSGFPFFLSVSHSICDTRLDLGF